jgi:hypothetical protein
MGGGVSTDRITVDGMPVGYMYRERVTRAGNSGWTFLAGDESDAYLDEVSHSAVYEVNTIANFDPDIIPYFQTPAPCAFEKVPGSAENKKVEG